MLNTATLSAKLMRIGAGLLLVALVSIGLTLWVTWQLEGGAAAVNEAGRMRMQTWRLTSEVQAQAQHTEVAQRLAQFDDSMRLLRHGDASRPLFVPWDDEVRREFLAVQTMLDHQRALWLAPDEAPPQQALAAAGAFVHAIDRLVLSIEKQLAELTAILNLFQFVMMALAIGGSVVMLYTGHLYIINPMARLREGLQQLESADFSVRVNVDTNDEFGQVAAGFNRMAATLQSLYGKLEVQVAHKTQRIEAQRARLEALYEVSAFLASINTIEGMSKGFAQRVRQVMNADAVTVRWSDEANQRYLMLASDCFPDDMQEDERSLLAGACACGNLQPDARTRVIPIVQLGDVPLQRCAKAGYQSLISVPVRLQQRLIGEIDLFFRTPATLSADEAELLDALASHLASALEGLRAAALEREAAVGQERALIANELHDSIAQSLAFLKIQVQLLRNAVAKNNPTQTQVTLDELDAGLRESIHDVRELLLHFRTRTNTDDIAGALKETLQKFQHQSGLSAHLHTTGSGLPLPADVQVQVLHVLQEALSNVRKHASASHVDLTVTKGAAWRFAVSDNGHGFDTGRTHSETHVGMKIMRERAERIGARVLVESTPGKGTQITLTVPPHPVSTHRPTHTAPPTTQTTAATPATAAPVAALAPHATPT